MSASRQRIELLRDRLKSFTRLLRQVEQGDVRAIHRTRVATRRLRELIPILQLDQRTSARLLRDLRKATRALGRVRELDVTLQLLTDLRSPTGAPAGAALTVVSKHLVEARRAALARETRKGRLSSDLRRLGKRLDRTASTLDRSGGRERQRWRWALQARVVRRAEVLKAAIRDAGPFYLPERLHAVRIALKKLRYSVELDVEASGVARPELNTLSRGQQLLGTLHDRQLLIERFRETQATLAPEDRRISRQLDALIARLEDECRMHHARYVRLRRGMLEACDRLAPLGSTRAESQDAPATSLASAL